MCKDFRAFARVPFGYEIINGKAEIKKDVAEQLLNFYMNYLDGDSMATAARKAGLQCSLSTLPRLLKRREYTGTDFYPQLITPAYQEQLVAEWTRRKSESPRQSKTPAQKGVRIYTDFKLNIPTVDNMTVEEIYTHIRPVYKSTLPTK